MTGEQRHDTPGPVPPPSDGERGPTRSFRIPRTWDDVEERTREFEALLERYDGDFQKATDAQLRGERADRPDPPGPAHLA